CTGTVPLPGEPDARAVSIIVPLGKAKFWVAVIPPAALRFKPVPVIRLIAETLLRVIAPVMFAVNVPPVRKLKVPMLILPPPAVDSEALPPVTPMYCRFKAGTLKLDRLTAPPVVATSPRAETALAAALPVVMLMLPPSRDTLANGEVLKGLGLAVESEAMEAMVPVRLTELPVMVMVPLAPA